MAEAKTRYKIDGATVELDIDEMYALVNTAERLGDLFDNGRLPSQLQDPQATAELKLVFDISRTIANIAYPR